MSRVTFGKTNGECDLELSFLEHLKPAKLEDLLQMVWQSRDGPSSSTAEAQGVLELTVLSASCRVRLSCPRFLEMGVLPRPEA